jgi:hypothetical protein
MLMRPVGTRESERGESLSTVPPGRVFIWRSYPSDKSLGNFQLPYRAQRGAI